MYDHVRASSTQSSECYYTKPYVLPTPRRYVVRVCAGGPRRARREGEKTWKGRKSGDQLQRCLSRERQTVVERRVQASALV